MVSWPRMSRWAALLASCSCNEAGIPIGIVPFTAPERRCWITCISSCARVWGEAREARTVAATEYDVGTDGVCPGIDCVGRFSGQGIVVYAHLRERVTEDGLHPIGPDRDQRFAR
jgi:hypothetical protein